MKKKITRELAEENGDRFRTVAALREWINSEEFEDTDTLDCWSETYDEDSADPILTIKRVREETDAEYTERFNREELAKKQREALMKAQRYQDYLMMRDEFEAKPEVEVGEVA